VNPRLPAHVARLSPYSPGKPVEELERELGLREIIKLASNENPLGPSPGALAALREAQAGVNRYPDGGGFHLRRRLAGLHGMPPEAIVLGSGSTELVELLARTFLDPETEAVISEGAFVMYRIATLAAHGRAHLVPWQDDLGHDALAMAAAVGPSTRLVFIANPNNPTGTFISKSTLRLMLDRIPPDVLVALDEAYIDYVVDPDYPDGAALLGRHPNLVVLRTFSKIHGLAGLRIGYCLADPQVAAVLERMRSPFNTSSLSQAAALGALDDREHVVHSRQENLRERARLEEGLVRMEASFTPSVGNFVLAHIGERARDVYNLMLGQGVIVRPMAGFGFPGSLRISVGRPGETDRCVDALQKALGGLS